MIIKNVLLLLLIAPNLALAQRRPQSFTVAPREDGWGIMHTVAPGETIFSLGRSYHIPPAILAEANGLTYNDGLKTGADIFLPLGVYNQKAALPVNADTLVLLQYRMQAQDNLYSVSRRAGVSQRILQQWNGLKEGQELVGKMLMVGSVMYNTSATAIVLPPPTTATVWTASPAGTLIDSDVKYILKPDTTSPLPAIPVKDTVVQTKPVNSLEALFAEQTTGGKNMVQEKASAGFYQLTGNAPGAALFAFHNAAAKGTVIRVKNIANGRVAYVKVLGAVPNSKPYAGCAIGLSNAVKAVLGVQESKAFVELSYAGY